MTPHGPRSVARITVVPARFPRTTPASVTSANELSSEANDGLASVAASVAGTTFPFPSRGVATNSMTLPSDRVSAEPYDEAGGMPRTSSARRLGRCCTVRALRTVEMSCAPVPYRASTSTCDVPFDVARRMAPSGPPLRSTTVSPSKVLHRASISARRAPDPSRTSSVSIAESPSDRSVSPAGVRMATITGSRSGDVPPSHPSVAQSDNAASFWKRTLPRPRESGARRAWYRRIVAHPEIMTDEVHLNLTMRTVPPRASKSCVG